MTSASISRSHLGVYFSDIGQRCIQTDSWMHMYTFTLNPISRDLHPLQTRLASCDDTLNWSLSDERWCTFHKPLIGNLTEIDNKMYSYFNGTMRHLADLLTNISTSPRTRDKRGLFNLGGQFLSWAFWTMSDDDRQWLDKKLAEMENITALMANSFAVS